MLLKFIFNGFSTIVFSPDFKKIEIINKNCKSFFINPFFGKLDNGPLSNHSLHNFGTPLRVCSFIRLQLKQKIIYFKD